MTNSLELTTIHRKRDWCPDRLWEFACGHWLALAFVLSVNVTDSEDVADGE